VDQTKRRANERKFEHWYDLPNGGRKYWYDVSGRIGWMARYVKEVDAQEETILFYQEIYNEQGELVEYHQKYPEDKRHKRLDED
jgi:hypothetical protein